jgi:hypothetical protein
VVVVVVSTVAVAAASWLVLTSSTSSKGIRVAAPAVVVRQRIKIIMVRVKPTFQRQSIPTIEVLLQNEKTKTKQKQGSLFRTARSKFWGEAK